VATLHVLAHSVKDPCPVLNIFTRW
jgi:hypothetical protein